MSMFQKATRTKARLRMALLGPAGSGKTYTALRIAAPLAEGGRIAVLDTEHGSASLYADEENPDGGRFDFDVVRLDEWPGKFSVENYIRAIEGAGKAGYPVLVVDSLSHAWAGEGGLLSFVDEAAAKSRGNSYVAWREATPLHNQLVDALLSYPGHVVVTMRTKVEYVMETNSKGKQEPKKIGMQPIQRDGLDYEFTVVGDLDLDHHKLVITKSRCSAVAGKVYTKAGGDVARVLLTWLNQGADEPVAPPKPPKETPDERAARQAQHHPSWTADREWFCATMSETFHELKDAPGAVAAFCESMGMAPPSGMGHDMRKKTLERLKSDDGQVKFWTWHADNAADYPLKAGAA